MVDAVLVDVARCLPQGVCSNAQLDAEHPEWEMAKIAAKIGVEERRIAAAGECASDLAVAAAERLFERHPAWRQDIDFLLFCTQCPDYALPTTACLVQHRLGLATTCGALDFNLGCSGYPYGLGLAKGLVASGQARRVLFLTGDTYSRYLRSDDRTTRALFGDGATASVIAAGDADLPGGHISAVTYGTDGAGARNLIAAGGGHRTTGLDQRAPVGNPPRLYMDGPEIFRFTLKAVPRNLAQLYGQAGISADEVDLFVFHQANQHMLEHLRRKLKIPAERFVVSMASTGNTISSTIPIVLEGLQRDHRLTTGMKVVLIGFGVGYSWSSCLLEWR